MGDRTTMKLLQDGKPCELDNPAINIARWYVHRTGGWGDELVSDERADYLSKYFSEVEVDNDESTNGN